RGAVVAGVPPYALLHDGERYDGGHFLGKGFNPFFVKCAENKQDFPVPNLTLVGGLTTERLNERRELLAGFDRANRIVDARGNADALDEFQRQAFDMVTGPAARRAFNLDQEPAAVRDRYGRNPQGQRMLLAPRLPHPRL